MVSGLSTGKDIAVNKSIVVVCITLLLLVACESKQPSRDIIQSTPPAPAASLTSSDSSATPDEYKKELVTEFIAAFSDESMWREELHGTNEACKAITKFERMHRAMGNMKEGRFTWSDVNMSEENGQLAYTRAVTASIKELANAMTMSREEREKIGVCGQGDGGIDFTEGEMLVVEFETTLAEFKMTPEFFGTSPKAVRKFLLQDYKSQIALIRSSKRTDGTLTSDGQGGLITIVKDAMEIWKFTQAELGLTDDEVRLAK
jgi:hypothetical protein